MDHTSDGSGPGPNRSPTSNNTGVNSNVRKVAKARPPAIALDSCVHHWVDGRPAVHEDPDFFCSGCNLQTLFILWYLENELGEALK